MTLIARFLSFSRIFKIELIGTQLIAMHLAKQIFHNNRIKKRITFNNTEKYIKLVICFSNILKSYFDYIFRKVVREVIKISDGVRGNTSLIHAFILTNF